MAQKVSRLELPRHIRRAIKSGLIPTLRDWRSIPMEERTRAELNMTFIEAYCIIPEGVAVGQPVRLADFQEAFFYAVYDGVVRVYKALLSIARKNAKTATIAMIVLVHLVGPEAIQNSEINSGALTRDQAAQVYKYASKMVALSPDLSGLIRPVPSSKKLIGLPMNTEYFALSADAKTNHGGSPVLAILDELGQIRGPHSDFVEAVETSQGAYEGVALEICISTQAPVDGDLWSIMLDDAEVSGDDGIVSHVYTADEDCDLLDEDQWLNANPALGLFRSITDVRQKAEEASRSPTKEAGFRVLFLNQRVNMTSLFVAPSVWKANSEKPAPFVGPVFGGLDLSKTTDLTAFVLTNRHNGRLHVKPFFWMPHDMVKEASKRDRAPYDVWVKQGLMMTTPGHTVDYDFVARDIGRICAEYDMAGIAFDDWNMHRLQFFLDQRGINLPMENWRQGYKTMSPSLDALEADLLNERVNHGSHPVLNMCAMNATVKPDPSENRKLDKLLSTGRIDGMQALAMAVGLEAQDMGPKLDIDDFLSAPVMVI